MRATKKQRSAEATGQMAGDPVTYTVDGFCRAHHMARSHFYDLVREGQGPRLLRAGRRTLISGDAAADWRRAMEERTAATSSAA